MTLHVALTHRTTYRYDHAIGLGPHVIRLRPAPHCRTPILAYSLDIAPKTHFLNWQQDPFGNFLARVVIPQETMAFAVTVDLMADMAAINPFDYFVEESAARYPFAYDPVLESELEPYLHKLPDEPLVESYLADIDRTGQSTTDFVIALNRRLAADIAYRVRMEHGVQTPTETLTMRSGSCRDSGWLLVQMLRRLGLAARFVSGYLIQLAPDRPPADGSGPAQDFTDLHAWAEVYVPGAGWIGLDPTSGLLAGEGHIPLAATPSPITAAPISGTHGAAKVDFAVDMQVRRVRETPRVSKPYTDAQWSALIAVGETVDARLAAGDVRLTMGGEPTFVATGDGQAPEWTTAALGPSKRDFADRLARRLRARFAPGGLLHYGQGKWYPGEAAPRWAFNIYWRGDGVPLWRDADLVAEEKPPRPAGIAEAGQFISGLARSLGLAADSAIPAYEDAAHFRLLEEKLPLGVTPGDEQRLNVEERDRLVRAFARGLDVPVGYVLPLLGVKRGEAPTVFVTERWAFRRGKLVLAPGDFPVGLRLPFAGLQDIALEDYPDVQPVDPFADRDKLPQQPHSRSEASQPLDAAAAGPVRTALAVEPRGGHLCVFLPPLRDGEDYAILVGAIEATAAALQLPVRLEGYAPPLDPRINVIKVTPDPGVIEVNVHPAQTWSHAVDITSAVYAEAEAVGLGAEKFQLDGRHVGTGGGNHVVLGGPTPADSPFLRRPDLLASIIAYWQNHPALSYLFSGLFVGPTSQAPRTDEARHEQLYELEIALRQIPEPGAHVPPWLVDRLFRNLLVDVTGNTHRAEICIDKLYAPEGPMGRLGLVEFRAFEMTPHPRMSLAQQLLIRALVAWFWNQPYRQPLVRWGSTLHDRFMLPHFLWADFTSVIADLNRAGFAIEAAWFVPHLEFRCPVWGAVTHAGVELELRQALEPWLVLGETSTSGATARPVDSSLDRAQVRVINPNPERYHVACNGHALPLAPTGRSGETVAGVRYRAWQPHEGFHPTIAPHVPLTFDVFDRWTGRSVGGCRYHATHPGGRNFETLPVNALEAAGRRNARFESTGHSAGSTDPKLGGVHPEFPLTLDLRRVG